MYIRKRFISAGYKIIVSILASIAATMLFVVYGTDAWRLFSTWSMLLIAGYFLLASIYALLRKNHESGQVFCPMLQGACIIAGATLVLMKNLSLAGVFTLPEVGGFAVIFINYLLPIIVLFDWILFSKKGFWQTIDPWYWLALPICYVTVMILTANYLPKTTSLLYPYEFLNYPEIGLDRTLWWIAIFSLVELVFGYLMFCLDALISGHLSKYIVLPKIKTIIIEEPVAETESEKVSTPVRSIKKSTADIKPNPKVIPTQPETPMKRVKVQSEKPTDASAEPKPDSKAKKTSRRVVTVSSDTEDKQKPAQPAASEQKDDPNSPTQSSPKPNSSQPKSAKKPSEPIIRKEALREKAKTEQAKKAAALQEAQEVEPKITKSSSEQPPVPTKTDLETSTSESKPAPDSCRDSVANVEIIEEVREVKEVILGGAETPDHSEEESPAEERK